MVTTLAGNGAGMQRHAAVARAARRLAAVSIRERQRRGGDGRGLLAPGGARSWRGRGQLAKLLAGNDIFLY